MMKHNSGILPLLLVGVLISNILPAQEELAFTGDNGADEILSEEYMDWTFDALGFQASHRTIADLRIRENPGTASPILTTLDIGTEVQLLEIGPTAFIGIAIAPWVKIVSSDGYTGWCFSGYLEVIQDLFFVEAGFEDMISGVVPVVLNPENVFNAVFENSVDIVEPTQNLPQWTLITAVCIIGGSALLAGGVALLAARRKRR